MRDVLPTLNQWAHDKKRFALATVTKTWGSSPRGVGSCMGVNSDGAICGSVSGGCIESAVIEASMEAMADGELRRLHFGHITDEMAWEVGLSCGGEVDVFIDPAPDTRDASLWTSLVESIENGKSCVLATRYEPFSQTLWSPGSPGTEIDQVYKTRRSQEVEIEGEVWFCNVLQCRDRLIIVGAVHIAQPLVRFANELGFETIVIDPRTAFANDERFENRPDQIVAKWPQEAFKEIAINEDTFAVVLTHDPKIDDAALAILLKSPAAYIGALGSKKTQEKKRSDLKERGFTDRDLDRIHGPVGLNIGAKSPEEIALSIIAEIVQVKRARS